ncbi:hypothetical protein CJ203_01295 [Corynebacterium tuscaniense]|uniref:Uncharacterized protein n=3 Tax=Corynebacteriaceae TaxID=1653 RepID=A0A2N6T884_9CORY|nr:hypothetical protein CJ203_01295 [Corynebacterium tuscaniense]
MNIGNIVITMKPPFSTRSLCALAASLSVAAGLTACSSQDDSLAEPALSEPPAITSAQDTTTSNEAPEEEPDSDKNELPELAPLEQALEGVLMEVGYRDMTPPDMYERVQYADTGQRYYAIKLDPVKPLDAQMGGTRITREAEWAILKNIERNSATAELDWPTLLNKRMRVFAHQDDIIFGSDPGIPYLAVSLQRFTRDPQVLG